MRKFLALWQFRVSPKANSIFSDQFFITFCCGKRKSFPIEQDKGVSKTTMAMTPWCEMRFCEFAFLWFNFGANSQCAVPLSGNSKTHFAPAFCTPFCSFRSSTLVVSGSVLPKISFWRQCVRSNPQRQCALKQQQALNRQFKHQTLFLERNVTQKEQPIQCLQFVPPPKKKPSIIGCFFWVTFRSWIGA